MMELSPEPARLADEKVCSGAFSRHFQRFIDEERTIESGDCINLTWPEWDKMNLEAPDNVGRRS